MERSIQSLAAEQARLGEEINKKENKVEAERIFKDTEMLKDKNCHFENELKVAHHKIEKIEILNEKAERLQAKKEVEILKEIEERVKKELRVSITNSPIGSVSNQIGSLSSVQTPNHNTTHAPTNNPNPSNFYNRKDPKTDLEETSRRPSISI